MLLSAQAKVNVIERLKFDLIYYDVTVQDFTNYATGTPHR